ncbi:MAG: glycosyltransferase family 4 protein [Ignavibacteriaceae bacterium]
MSIKEQIQKVAFVSDYIPRRCGIATFTADLNTAIVNQYPRIDTQIISVNDTSEGYNYSEEVRFEISEQDILSYRRAADFLNFSHTEVVSLQHEFGIFGGQAGSHILALMEDLQMPVVTTFHTILKEPNPEQKNVMNKLIERSARMVVMSEKGRDFLREIYSAPAEKIDLIPHGIPDMPFVDPNFYKDQFGVEGKFVLLTFGLLSPNKGIEVVLRALPQVLKHFPETVYIVLGATHPNLVKTEGESYRLKLERIAKDLGIRKNVIFYNRFVDIEELKEFLGATDIYITPYLSKAQITSGTLSYAFGCGKAVISTPYWHAEELLADERGLLVPFNDPEALAEKIIYLLSNDTIRHSMRKKAYMLGREFVWNNIAHLYAESFVKARESRTSFRSSPLKIKTLDEQISNLPEIRLNHLKRLTDSTGIIQHARYSLPHYEDGYTLDDNARALILTVLMESAAVDKEELNELMMIYAAFVNYAYDSRNKRFRNFMSYSGNWLEKTGSEDSNGRAIWALGTCIGRSENKEITNWAAEKFSSVLPLTTNFTSPRAWAFTLLGIYEYCKRLSGDRHVNMIRDELEKKLNDLYAQNARDSWNWFENYLTYCNAHLSHALICSGEISGSELSLRNGLISLKWLCKVQHSSSGNFSPVGNNGFYKNGERKNEYDQQPVEAFATVYACLSAYRITSDKLWLDEARLAFEWFLGRNDPAIPLYDPKSGGCRDGLHYDRPNHNMGAESTLAFLLSLILMQSIENSVSAVEKKITSPILLAD